ncbi:hypothetical protein ACB094_11G047400 [Castanea mollissima]
MAETAVLFLIDKLIPLLTQEATLLQGIHGEVADIKDELESIQSFLKDADARAAAEEEMSEGIKTWVKQVREEAFHIEVAIDRYLLHMAQQSHQRGFTGFLHKIIRLPKSLKPRHNIASEIQEIKASVQKIEERSEKYSFKSTSQGSSSGAQYIRWNDPRKDSLYLEDADVVGIEAPRDELINWLVEGPSHCIEISVVGMGGLGKTTLVKKVYDHQIVRGHFDCHAWILVSQSYNIEDLLKSIIKQFCEARKEFPLPRIDTMDEQSLINILRDYLWQKRKSSPIHVYELQPLPPNEAWELFCKRGFQFDFGGHCPQVLEKLSHEHVEKCEGLPSAIVAIGGLMSTKDKTILEWQNLQNSHGIELQRNPHLSALSFDDLPYNLKSCFLYLGMYPEDYYINCVKLIRQWIVEGFVKEIESKTLEEVGREYLTELIHRSLVQVTRVDFDGKVRLCRLHGLFHEIVLQKMKGLSFVHVLSKQESNFEGLTRRMALRLSDDPMKAFQTLPNLLELKIFNQAYNGEQLQFEIGGFPKLRLLWLRHLDKLNSLIINEGALPLLEKLLIGPSPQLKEVLSGIKHVRSLKSIEFWDMPKEFEESLDPEQGSCHWIIEHVPIIYLYHVVGKGYYDFDTRILYSKHLERSRGLTINHIDNHNNNYSDDAEKITNKLQALPNRNNTCKKKKRRPNREHRCGVSQKPSEGQVRVFYNPRVPESS